MNTAKRLAAVSLLALAALTLAQNSRIELQATLSGIGKGRAVWKVDDRGTQFQAELQAEGEGLPRNAPLSVSVGSNPAFAVVTDNFGTWRISRRYTTALRPTISAGDPVAVTDGNSTVVQSGIMQPR